MTEPALVEMPASKAGHQPGHPVWISETAVWNSDSVDVELLFDMPARTRLAPAQSGARLPEKVQQSRPQERHKEKVAAIPGEERTTRDESCQRALTACLT